MKDFAFLWKHVALLYSSSNPCFGTFLKPNTTHFCIPYERENKCNNITTIKVQFEKHNDWKKKLINCVHRSHWSGQHNNYLGTLFYFFQQGFVRTQTKFNCMIIMGVLWGLDTIFLIEGCRSWVSSMLAKPNICGGTGLSCYCADCYQK